MPAKTIDEYLKSLPKDRRTALTRVRDVVNQNLPPGYKEGIQYGVISWYVPKQKLPATYNDQPLALACLASQQNHMALYLMSIYGDEKLRKWFVSAYSKTGKPLDMGKSCVRFKDIKELPLEVIGEAIKRVPVDQYVSVYHESRKQLAEKAKAARNGKSKRKAAPAKKPPKKKR